MTTKEEKMKQMRFSRRLEQAIAEEASATVLRTAINQARAAGCDNSKLHAAILRRGEALLTQAEAQESSETLRALAATKASSAFKDELERICHDTQGLPRLLARVSKVPMGAKLPLDYLAASRRIASKELTMSRNSERNNGSECASAMLVLTEQQHLIRELLKSGTQEIKAMAARPDTLKSNLFAAARCLKRLVEEARSYELEEQELASCLAAIDEAPTVWSHVLRDVEFTKVHDVDFRIDDEKHVVSTKRQRSKSLPSRLNLGGYPTEVFDMTDPDDTVIDLSFDEFLKA
jgi:hypothetical protein